MISSEEVNDGNLGISNHHFFRQVGKFEYVVERKRQRGMGARPRRTAELLVQETGRNDGGKSCVARPAAFTPLLSVEQRQNWGKDQTMAENPENPKPTTDPDQLTLIILFAQI
jgi:hypothetical protein